MIRWPGRLGPGKSKEMVASHDFLPTLASILGAELPGDRPDDGVDRSAFLLGRQDRSAREHLITLVENEIAAMCWRKYGICPRAFGPSFGDPAQEGALG